MQYQPKELKGNVNVSPRSPIKEFFLLLGGILGIILAIYVILGFAVEIVVDKLPLKVEERLGNVFSKAFSDQKNAEAEKKLQEILNNLGYPQYNIHVITEDKTVNAFAYPGGNIVVFSGLLKKVNSENELAFVLAHELGHFVNRDHLKGLGRSLVLFTLSAFIFGDSNVTNFLQGSLVNTEMKFSQAQETAADLFALDLLNKKYGHAAGALDFFDVLLKEEKCPRFLYFFATHRHPLNRKKIIAQQIKIKGCEIKNTLPLKMEVRNGAEPVSQ